jgi:hypothetical protein
MKIQTFEVKVAVPDYCDKIEGHALYEVFQQTDNVRDDLSECAWEIKMIDADDVEEKKNENYNGERKRTMNYENVTSIKTLIDHPGGIFSYRNWDDLIDFYFNKYGEYIDKSECTRVLHIEQCNCLSRVFQKPLFPKTSCNDIKDEVYKNTHVLQTTRMDWTVGMRAGCTGSPDVRNTGYCSIRFELDPYKKHAYSEGKHIQDTMLQMLARCANRNTPMFVLIQEPYIEGYVNILKQCDPVVVEKLKLNE